MRHHLHDRARRELFHARGTGIAPSDAQDLMSWPYFSFAKSLRLAPIDCRMGEISISTEVTIERNILRERCLAVAHVQASAEILLTAAGWPNVAKVMKNSDAIEAIDIDPADVSPDYWRHSHSRLAAQEAPRSYIRQRHEVRLLRRRTEP